MTRPDRDREQEADRAGEVVSFPGAEPAEQQPVPRARSTAPLDTVVGEGRWHAVDTEDNITMGRRLRRIRLARRKTQQVVADRAGISKGYLSMLERGERTLDSLRLIVALAGALEIAPSELTEIPIPAPGNGHTDSVVEAVRLALDAVAVNSPGGLVLPADVLAGRVTRLHEMSRRARFPEVAGDLPGLIRDLHTSIAAGRDVPELLALAVHLHVHVTRMWLGYAGAPVDLRRRAVFLARNMAQEHGEPTTLGMAAYGTADVLLTGGGTAGLARAELDSVTLPAATADTVGLLCAVTATRALLAAVDGRPGDTDAAMESAADLAARFGEIGEADPLGFSFGPVNVGIRRMGLALDAREPDRAVSIARDVRPEQNPFTTTRVRYWIDYGRGAARLRRQRDDAIRAFRTAEELFPVRVYRDPLARDAIAGLVERSRADAAGRELRGLASRAGLL
ncbi:MAG: helix-turn-helix domain-containing protein [Pseudonocardiaceae bacterium]